MSSIIVNFEDLHNITADVVCAPAGALEIVPGGVQVAEAQRVPTTGNPADVLTKDAGGLPKWVAPSAGGSPQYSTEVNYGNDINNNTSENAFFAKKITASTLAIPGLAALRIKAWGIISNTATPTTFIPRIRWNTAANLAGSPVTLLTGPTLQGTSTLQTLKAWELDSVFILNTPIAFVTMNITNHTEDSTGLPKQNCVNNGASGVNLVSTNVDRYIMLSWQMSNTGSGNRVACYAAMVELLYSL